MKLRELSRKATVRRLDDWFSRYIRWRDADSKGLAKCCTCSKVAHVTKLQCGHFMSRKRRATRWMELNCSNQCFGCNMRQQGNQYEFSKYIDRKHGEGMAEAIHLLSLKKVKHTTDELMKLTEYYKKETKKLTRIYGQ